MVNELIGRETRTPGTTNKAMPGEERAAVEALFHQYWNEQCVSVFVPYYEPKFSVDGLRSNGSDKGRDTVSWLLERGFCIIFGIFSYSSEDRRFGSYAKTGGGQDTLGNGHVQGDPNSMAVQIARSTEAGTKWLTWSANHIALFDYDIKKQLGVRWHASTPDLPTYHHDEPSDIVLSWPDGSSYTLKLTVGEANRLSTIELGQQPADDNHGLSRWLGGNH